jgi:hypothetical protein
MVVKVILAIAAAAFVGALSGSTDVWARGGKSAMVAGCAPHGWERTRTVFTVSLVAGTFRARCTVRTDTINIRRSNSIVTTLRRGSGTRPRASSRISAEIGRVAAAPVAVGDGYGGSVGDVCINSQFCQGVWYQVTKSPTSSESSASYKRNSQPFDK